MGKNVVIYSTPTCGFCVKAKDYFKENNISFQEFDVSSNQEKVNEMIEKSGQMSVPVIDIDGEIIVGFDKEKIRQILAL